MTSRILPLLALSPALASAANITLGFEELTGYNPLVEVPNAFVGQPYPDYINLTVNQPYYVYDFGGYAVEGTQFISGGFGTSYDVSALSGVSLLGVSLHGFEGNDDVNFQPLPSGTVMATISLYTSGNLLVSTINVVSNVAAGVPTTYVFSDYTLLSIDRFVIAESVTPDSGGFAVDAIVVNGSAVPEPSTYGLMIGGLALAAVAARRRRTAKAKADAEATN